MAPCNNGPRGATLENLPYFYHTISFWLTMCRWNLLLSADPPATKYGVGVLCGKEGANVEVYAAGGELVRLVDVGHRNGAPTKREYANRWPSAIWSNRNVVCISDVRSRSQTSARECTTPLVSMHALCAAMKLEEAPWRLVLHRPCYTFSESKGLSSAVDSPVASMHIIGSCLVDRQSLEFR